QPVAAARQTGKLKGIANVVAADIDGDGSEEVYRFERGKQVQRITFKCANRGNAVVLDLEGVIRNDVQAGWSNLEGRGALVEVKAGARSQKFRLGNPSGFGCAAGTRVVAGLGSSTQADYVRVRWPHAAQQAAMDVPSGA